MANDAYRKDMKETSISVIPKKRCSYSGRDESVEERFAVEKSSVYVFFMVDCLSPWPCLDPSKHEVLPYYSNNNTRPLNKKKHSKYQPPGS